MQRNPREPEDWEEERQEDDPDRELPDPSDMDDDDEPDWIPCPHCRKFITEDAERCHHCGQDIVHATQAEGMSMILIFIIAALVIVFVGGVVLLYF